MLAYLLAHLEAIQLRQYDVGDDELEGVVLKEAQPHLAVVRHHYLIAVFLQTYLQKVGHTLFVLYN